MMSKNNKINSTKKYVGFAKIILMIAVVSLFSMTGCNSQMNQKESDTKTSVAETNEIKTVDPAIADLLNITNRKEGLQKEYHDNGQLKSEGNYIADLKEGLHKEWDENGILLLEGFYKNGKANGLMKWYHEKGHFAAAGDMKDDIRIGKWKICDIEENGFCIEAFFENGKREGIWKIYHPNARDKLWKEQTFKNDKFISEKCWDEKGIAMRCEE